MCEFVNAKTRLPPANTSWKDADPEDPVLKETEAEYATLE
jgi:hypothetical protein